MRQILIVDDGAAPLLAKLQSQLKAKQDRFAILSAGSAQDALAILGAKKIDLVLSVWGPSFVDSFLLEISEASSAFPILVLVPESAWSLGNEIKIFYRCDVLKLSSTADEVMRKIASMLQIPDDDGFLTDIAPASFLKKIYKKKETALLKVLAPDGRTGLIFVHSGEIWDVSFGVFKGEKALFVLLSEEGLRVKFLKIPDRKIKRKIQKALPELLESWAAGEEPLADYDDVLLTTPAAPEHDPLPRSVAAVSPTLVRAAFAEEAPQPPPVNKTSASSKIVLELEEAEPAPYLREKKFEGIDDWIQEVDEGRGHDSPSLRSNGDAGKSAVGSTMGSAPSSSAGSFAPGHGEAEMLSLSDEESKKIGILLKKMKQIEGFLAVGLFTPGGALLAEVNHSGMHLQDFGTIANDVMSKAQMATEILGLGLCDVIHINAPQAQILVHCHNESDDPEVLAKEGTHIHMILIMGKHGNIGAGKFFLASTCADIASVFRERPD